MHDEVPVSAQGLGYYGLGKVPGSVLGLYLTAAIIVFFDRLRPKTNNTYPTMKWALITQAKSAFLNGEPLEIILNIV